MAASIEERIKLLETKLKQAKALAAKKTAAERTRIESEKRRSETRKRVLIGAFVIAQLERTSIDASQLEFAGKSFGDWLTRDDERALFGLSVIESETAKVD
jgi:hypothetical protein